MLLRRFSLRAFLLGLVFFIALSSLAGLLLGDFYYTKERFPRNAFIENVEVSLLTKREAENKLSHTPVDEVFATSFALNSEVGSFRFKPSSLGVFVLPSASVNHAFDLTHQKNYLEGFSKRLSHPTTIAPAAVTADEDMLKNTLIDLASEIQVSSKEAGVDLKENGAFAFVPEVIGRELQIKESLSSAKKALNAGEKTLPIKVSLFSPRIILADIQGHPPVQELSKYTTYYGSHDSKERISNIKLIASLIDNHILLSGEGFSLLSMVGDFSAERGFKEALVIMGDELAYEYGGGTCQIATTLFNSVSLADLRVTNRKNHSIWFNIYPLGRDATVYSKYLDFKFENSSPHPVMIKAWATNRYLTFQVLGTPTNKKVSFTKPEIEGKIGKGPFKTKVYRIVEEDGKVIKKETLWSYYRQAGDKDIKIRARKKAKGH